jgi:hypothetical protein
MPIMARHLGGCIPALLDPIDEVADVGPDVLAHAVITYMQQQHVLGERHHRAASNEHRIGMIVLGARRRRSIILEAVTVA